MHYSTNMIVEDKSQTYDNSFEYVNIRNEISLNQYF